jgi:MFS family permease
LRNGGFAGCLFGGEQRRDVTSDRRQRLLIGLGAATRFASGILMGTALAVYVGRRGSPFAVSMVLTAYFLGMMVFAPVWGAVADVTGRRRAVMAVTGALATLSVLPLLVADGAWTPIGVRGLYAVFAAGFAPVMLTIVSTHGGESGRGRSVGFFNSTRAVGFAGGQLTVGALLGLLAPDQLYLVIAGVSLVSTLAVVLVADPTPNPNSDPSVSEIRTEVKERLFPAAGERGHLKTNGLGWLYVALALRNMTVLGVMSLMPPYLTGQVGVSAFVMGALLAINPVGQAVFMVVFGRLADAVGRKPLITVGMAGSGCFAVIAGVATVPSGHLARLLVAGTGFVVIGAAFSAMTTGAIAFIGDVAPTERESELMGLRTTAKGVGGVLGPPIFGAVATVASYETAFLGGSVLAFAAAGLVGVRLVESRTGARRPVAADD